MKTKAALQATATIVAAIVLALFTVQGTLASWTASAATTSQSVRAADFTVTVAVGGMAAQPLAAGGVVAVQAPAGLKPWTSKVTPIVVTNATDAGGTFTVESTLTVQTATGPLAPYLVAGIGVGRGGDCATARQGRTVVLDKGASATFCLTTALKADTPVALGGKGASITLTLATQQQQQPQ